MLTKLLVWTLFIGVATPLSAQAPLPAALIAAKRAYLVNEAGDLKRFNSLADELKKWGRFELVDAEEKADIVLVFGSSVKGHVGSGVNGTVTVAPVIQLSLVARDHVGALLWNDVSPPVGASGRFVSICARISTGRNRPRRIVRAV